jgi:autotransporter-associated beta strand protein
MFGAVLPMRAQTVIWMGGGADQNYTTAGNWAGGIVPPNTGTDTMDLSDLPQASTIRVNTPANLFGLQFLGSSPDFPTYTLSLGAGGSLTIGSGGISPQSTAFPILHLGIPVILSQNQTWNGTASGEISVDASANVSGTGSLTITGRLVMDGTNNTFSGGLIDSSSGIVLAGSDSAAGTGTLTLNDGATFESSGQAVTLSNPVTLGNNVLLGSGSPAQTLTFSGPVTTVNGTTTVDIIPGASIVMAGTLTGLSPSNVVFLGTGAPGTGSKLLGDGGSQVVFEGSLSQVTGLAVSNSSLILAPTGSAGTAFASLSSPGVQVMNQGYLGLDGTFVAPTAVSGFLAANGSQLGSTINGTLGFDTIASGSPNVFPDPIDLSQFTSAQFLGLGTATVATLASTAVITPANNNYIFGGGGGTLTVQSPLADGFTARRVTMRAAPEPLTLVLQGNNTYSGGTFVNGGVMIFDSPVPSTGLFSVPAGYLGYTELATNVASPQAFVNQFNTFLTNGVIGFDSTSADTISGSIDLSRFDFASHPFIGTSSGVTLTGAITPANNAYQFTAVKGSVLTVASNLTAAGSTLTIGLNTPIETDGTTSSVTLTGDNAAIIRTTFNSGMLLINNGNALGSGPISVPNTAATGAFPDLVSFGGATVSLTNSISIGSFFSGPNPGLTVGNSAPAVGDMLVLGGAITDGGTQHGMLSIVGPVTLTGANSYSGGTSFSGNGNAVAFVANSTPFGTGTITTQSASAIIPFNGDVTLGNNVDINGALTLGQAGNGNRLTLNGAITGGATLTIISNAALGGVNTSFTGQALIDDANVVIGNASALGTGSVHLTNGGSLSDAIASATLFDLSGDSTSTVSLAPNSILTLDTNLNGAQPVNYLGTITGDVTDQVVKTGAGTEFLGGNSTYGGGTTVDAGILTAGTGNSLGGGPVTVENGAQLQVSNGVTLVNGLNLMGGGTLAGTGTFSPSGALTFAGGATVAPGFGTAHQYLGTLSFGTNVTFGTGGVFDFNIQNGSGVAGTDYTTMSTTGTLTISATPSAPFQIVVRSIDPGTGDLGPATFNLTQAASWTLVSAATIAGFNAGDFSVNTGGFQNMPGVNFVVGTNGNNLTLDFTPVPEPSTWLLLVAGLVSVVIHFRRRMRI